jgi:hypothetical protein
LRAPQKTLLEVAVELEHIAQILGLWKNRSCDTSRGLTAFVVHLLPQRQSASDPRVEKGVTLEQSAWFAVRVSGKPARGFGNDVPGTHSAPVYVNLAGKPVLIRGDVEMMIRWLGRFWGQSGRTEQFWTGSQPFECTQNVPSGDHPL